MSGEQLWNRSKIMLVGEGEVGKTSVAQSIMGTFVTEKIPSTCGIDALHMLSIDLSSGSGTAWGKFTKKEKVFNQAVAALVKRAFRSTILSKDGANNSTNSLGVQDHVVTNARKSPADSTTEVVDR
jgi:GTPase SAR1 family protein